MNFDDLMVSAAPAEIYALPGSLFEHHQITNAARTEAAGIRFLFELFPAEYYRHTANPDMIVDPADPWSAPLLDSYNADKHCHSAASVVVRIEDAIIDHSVVYCRTNDRVSILYETFRSPDRAAVPFSAAATSDVPFAAFQRPGFSYFYLGSVGSFNYGHWLVDDLPRAKAWMELRRREGVTCVFVLPSHGPQMDAVRTRTLQVLIDPGVEVQFIANNQPCRISGLYYASPVSFHPRIKNPSAIHFLRARARQCVPETAEPAGRRVFVARKPPISRAIVNYDELWPFLQARGFELVEAERLDFSDQIKLFQNASVVVGQMGAAMTNTLFCRPAATLIYLAPSGWPEPFYVDLAAIAGQHYNVLLGPTVTDGPIHMSDFSVSVDQLSRRLNYMGVL